MLRGRCGILGWCSLTVCSAVPTAFGNERHASEYVPNTACCQSSSQCHACAAANALCSWHVTTHYPHIAAAIRFASCEWESPSCVAYSYQLLPRIGTSPPGHLAFPVRPLTAVPADRATTPPPDVMQVALRRRLRLRLPLGPVTCGQEATAAEDGLTLAGIMPSHARTLATWLSRHGSLLKSSPAAADAHLRPRKYWHRTRRLDLVVYGCVRHLPTRPRVVLQCHA